MGSGAALVVVKRLQFALQGTARHCALCPRAGPMGAGDTLSRGCDQGVAGLDAVEDDLHGGFPRVVGCWAGSGAESKRPGLLVQPGPAVDGGRKRGASACQYTGAPGGATFENTPAMPAPERLPLPAVRRSGVTERVVDWAMNVCYGLVEVQRGQWLICTLAQMIN